MALAVMYAAVTACIGAWTVLPVMYTLIGHRTFSLHTDTLYKAIYTYGLVAYTSVRGQAYKSDLQDAEAYGDAKAPGDLAEKGVSKIDLVASEDPASPPKDTYGYSQAEYNRITSGYWYRSTRFVMAHPWVFLAGLLGCLGGLMYVFINNVRFGSGGTSLIPVDSEIRYAFDKFVAYIPGGNGAAINVFMQTSAPLGVRAPGFLTALDDYSANVKAISPHIITVRNLVRYNKSSTLSDYISIYADPYSAANFNATWYLDAPFYITDLNTISGTLIYLDLDTNDQQMFNIIRKVRALTSGSSVTSYLQAYGVGGGSALEFDIQQDVKETLPNMVAVIICAMGLMLTLLSASFVIPIKAIITATLSIISSFAFLVLVFQDGPQNAQDLLQFIPNGVLDPLNLIFIFAVAFGLSLDYEIFMISRIQELWLRTNDHYFAVAAGIEESARAITLAALLLCVVLGAFLASKIIILKEIGMGIGLTILLDATIIRCILVPAMMALFGEYTWWAPKPVQDAVTRLGLMEKHHSDVGAVSDSIPKPLRE
jgi:RND superfamily putative drug exporter